MAIDRLHKFKVWKPNFEHGAGIVGVIEVGAELVSVSGMWDVLANLDGILSGLLSEGGLGTCSFRSVRLQEGRKAGRRAAGAIIETD